MPQLRAGSDFGEVEFLGNYDGDTVKVNIPWIHSLLGKEISIRLRGVDTPEIRTRDACEKAMANVAKSFVFKKITESKKIELKNCERGKYFRLVCDINLDGKNLTEMLIKQKLGYPYDGGSKQNRDWCLSRTRRLHFEPKDSHESLCRSRPFTHECRYSNY